MKATEKLASINPITVYSDSIKNRDIEDVYKDLESKDITKENNNDLSLTTSDSGPNRKGKLFSLFNIVTFRQGPCPSLTGDTGVCMTMFECANTGVGVPSGNCASGFGVCCLMNVNQCGADISQNCTYFTNPEYPNPKTDNTPCEISIRRCSDNVCHIKLDFEESQLNTDYTKKRLI